MSSAPSDLLQQILSRLGNVKGPNPQGWYTTYCVFHQDGRNPNLGFTSTGYNCLSAQCGAKGSLRDLACHLGIELMVKGL